MTLKLNRRALEHARRLIDEDRYMINTVWSQNEPTPQQENQFLEKHGLDEYAKWYLAIDTEAPANTKARYKLPYGNFQKLHRSGITSIQQWAVRNQSDDILEGADQLLDMVDRMNAC